MAVNTTQGAILVTSSLEYSLFDLLQNSPDEFSKANYLKIAIDIGEGSPALPLLSQFVTHQCFAQLWLTCTPPDHRFMPKTSIQRTLKRVVLQTFCSFSQILIDWASLGSQTK